jgi:hypothetical protein
VAVTPHIVEIDAQDCALHAGVFEVGLVSEGHIGREFNNIFIYKLKIRFLKFKILNFKY